MGKGAGKCERSAFILDAAEGANVGMSVGDALGATLEFMSPESIKEAHGVLDEIIGGGVWQVRPGQITDDTEMALGIVKCLDEHKEYIGEEVVKNYLSWYYSDPVDVGMTVSSVLGRIDLELEDKPADFQATFFAKQFHLASGGKSAGNGSIMRQTPLAVFYKDDLDKLEEVIRADTGLTHYDPLAADCSVYYARQIARVINDPNAQLETSDNPAVQAAVDYTEDEIKEKVMSQMGFCLTTLAVATYAFRNAKSFEEGLVWATNLGGDTDTNGAVAGALLGAKFGYKNIPDRWKNKVEPADYLRHTTNKAFNGFSTS